MYHNEFVSFQFPKIGAGYSFCEPMLEFHSIANVDNCTNSIAPIKYTRLGVHFCSCLNYIKRKKRKNFSIKSERLVLWYWFPLNLIPKLVGNHYYFLRLHPTLNIRFRQIYTNEGHNSRLTRVYTSNKHHRQKLVSKAWDSAWRESRQERRNLFSFLLNSLESNLLAENLFTDFIIVYTKRHCYSEVIEKFTGNNFMENVRNDIINNRHFRVSNREAKFPTLQKFSAQQVLQLINRFSISSNETQPGLQSEEQLRSK